MSDEFEDLFDAKRPGQDCWAKRLESSDDLEYPEVKADVKRLEEAINAGRAPVMSKVHKYLKGKKVQAAYSSVGKHFKGECSCGTVTPNKS